MSAKVRLVRNGGSGTKRRETKSAKIPEIGSFESMHGFALFASLRFVFPCWAGERLPRASRKPGVRA